MDKIEKMINAFKTKTVDSAIIGFTIENNDNITNKVRKYLDSLPEEELISIQNYLKNLLNYCYNDVQRVVQEVKESRMLSTSSWKKSRHLAKCSQWQVEPSAATWN